MCCTDIRVWFSNCRPSVNHYYIKLSLGVPLTCSSAPHNKPEFSFLIVLFDTNSPINTFNQERCSIAKLEVMTSMTVSNFHEKQSNSRTAGRLGIPTLTTRTNLQPAKIQAMILSGGLGDSTVSPLLPIPDSLVFHVPGRFSEIQSTTAKLQEPWQTPV